MAADHDSLFSACNITSAASSSTLISNEDEVIMLQPLAAPALNPGAASAAATSSCFNMESNLLRVQTMAGAHNSIDRSARENGRVLNPALIPCTNVDIYRTSTHSCPPIHDVRSSLKRTLVDYAAVHLQVPAVDNELQLVALQDDDGEHCMSSITMAHETQSPSKKLHDTKVEGSTEQVEVARKEEEGEVDEAEEEEGCVTPTARDQRIPQYNVELNTSGLVCPPPPKKKPKFYASRRSRRLFYSANDAGGDVNYHIVAERRPFLVDPPDLHNFPDCIRALFK